MCSFTIGLSGCQSKKPDNESANHDLPLSAYFTAIENTWTNIDKVCYDYSSKLFLIHVTSEDADDKPWCGWNVMNKYEFYSLDNGTLFINRPGANWINTYVDTSDLKCSDSQ